MKRTFGVIIIGFLIFSCSSKPKTQYEATKTRGLWTGNLEIFDKAKGEENSLDFEAIASRKHGVRMELSAMLGTSVGALLLRPKSLRFLLTQEKRFYRGRPVAKSVVPLIGIELDPNLLYSVLFDTVPTGGDWQCKENKQGRLASCSSTKYQALASWTYSDGEQKVVDINTPKFKIRFNVDDFDGEFRLKKSHFSLKPPKGYKVYRIK